MRIAVLGAQSPVGRLVVDLLLTRGHEVSVLEEPSTAGNPDAGFACFSRVFQGSLSDFNVMHLWVSGADAVVSCRRTQPGPQIPGGAAMLLSRFMPAAGVKRFVGVTTAAVAVPGDVPCLRRRLRHWPSPSATEEMKVWAQSSLDWTLVRCGRITRATRPGRLAHDPHRFAGHHVSPGDLAILLAHATETRLYVNAAPFAASQPAHPGFVLAYPPGQHSALPGSTA
jgi:hypothetical protein